MTKNAAAKKSAPAAKVTSLATVRKALDGYMVGDVMIDAEAAKVIINHEERGKVAYAQYIKMHNMTADDISAHVKALVSVTYPTMPEDEEGKKERHNLATKYRGGFRYHLTDKKKKTSVSSDHLLTTKGVRAMVEMIENGASNEDVLAAILREVAARTANAE